jgi:hypothetical protein
MNEAERFKLQQALIQVIGAEPTETLMANLPPVPWTELASKSDLARLGTDLQGEMSQLRSELRTEMAEFRGELRTELATGLADIRIELHDELRLNTWRLVTAMGVFTGVLAALIRLG